MLRAFFNLSPHLRIAVLLAPFLVVAGYVLAGMYMDRKPAGQALKAPAIKLGVQGDCALSSGRCELLRGDLNVKLILDTDRIRATVTAHTPVEGVLLGIGELNPARLAQTGVADEWSMTLERALRFPVNIRLVVIRNGESYFSEFTAQ